MKLNREITFLTLLTHLLRWWIRDSRKVPYGVVSSRKSVIGATDTHRSVLLESTFSYKVPNWWSNRHSNFGGATRRRFSAIQGTLMGGGEGEGNRRPVRVFPNPPRHMGRGVPPCYLTQYLTDSRSENGIWYPRAWTFRIYNKILSVCLWWCHKSGQRPGFDCHHWLHWAK